MNITKKIKSYKDACKVLGLNPENQPCVDSILEKDRNSIIAYYKLIVIIRALNEDWEADFSNHDQYKFWNWLWVDSTGSVYASTSYTATYSGANVGVLLCFKNRKLAEYAITQFRSLYEEYLSIK